MLPERFVRSILRRPCGRYRRSALYGGKRLPAPTARPWAARRGPGVLPSMTARWLSLWLLTETYSPKAIDTAPPTSPATPAVRIGPCAAVTLATPTTIAATETMPSLAPRTPARNQFSREEWSLPCISASACMYVYRTQVSITTKQPSRRLCRHEAKHCLRKVNLTKSRFVRN